jgi:hypothetical protein
MATLHQIEANRRNSQKSTGPRSVEGKAVSRFNALKTGITARSMVIPGEDPAELDTLAAEYQNQFQAATALERFLVDALVSADWQLRRLRRVETQLWTNQIRDTKAPDDDTPLGRVVSRDPRSFALLQRRIDAAERSYYRTQLQRAQAERGQECPSADCQLAPQLVEEPQASPALASFSSSPVDGLTPSAEPAVPSPLPQS